MSVRMLTSVVACLRCRAYNSLARGYDFLWYAMVENQRVDVKDKIACPSYGPVNKFILTPTERHKPKPFLAGS